MRPRLALNLYRRCLWLYPAEFRAAYSHELCLFFVDRWREEHSPAGRLALWLASAFGVFREAPKEHFAMILLDLRYALRVLRKDRLVTLAAIAILGLGIGSTTLVFSLANGLLVRPLPYASLDRLVAVNEVKPNEARESRQLNFLNFLDLKARTKTLEHFGVYISGLATIRGEGEAQVVPGAAVTAGVFPALGVRPILGRWFTPAETVVKGPGVAILGSELWHQRYGGDPHILGRVLQVGKQSCVVVGVMPAGFHFPDRVEVWKPMQIDPADQARTDYWLSAIASLRPGVSSEQARSELQGMLSAIHQQNPGANNGYTMAVVPYRLQVSLEYRRSVFILLFAVGLLLLIACANVSNLLLVKASARGREMAVRTAIGASRSRIIRQLLVEGLVLGMAGGLLGLFLARLGVPALLSLLPDNMPLWMDFSLDNRVLVFCFSLSILTSLAFALAPAFTSSGGNVTEALKDGRGGTRRSVRRLQSGMVVAEVALSFTLLAAAGLMVRSFEAVRYQPLGFSPERVMTFSLSVPSDHYPSGPRYRELIKRLRTEIGALPGVESVAATSGVPLGEGWDRLFTIEGHEQPLKQMPTVNHIVATPEYFRTLRIPLLKGRTFNEDDWGRREVIVTRVFADTYWPGQDALGKRVRFGPPARHEPWHNVIGVVASSLHGNLRNTTRTNIYLPPNEDFSTSVLVVRAATDPARLVNEVERRLATIDRDIAVGEAKSLDRFLDLNVWRDRFLAVLCAAFASLALVLAAAGLYASLAYTVALQTHEIGVRIALGATAARVRRMVIGQGSRLVLLGLAFGVLAALAVTRLMRSELFGVSLFDPWTYIVAPIVLLAAAFVATLLPTRRAIRIDPVDALREQ
jgi:putative ABC transport system permease protein